MVSTGSKVMFVLLGISGLVFVLAFIFTRQLSSGHSTFVPLDHPNERSLHSRPTPRTGGVALLGSFFIGVTLFWGVRTLGLNSGWLDSLSNSIWTSTWVLAMTLLIAGVSFWDDRAQISVWIRFGTHILAAVGLMWNTELFLSHVEIPLVGTLDLEWVGVLFSGMYLIWMTNLYNFMDGVDGLAGGMTVMGFGILTCLAWRGEHHQIMVTSLFISLAACGFLIYNLPPARIFMGDIGSASLGFAVAAITLWGVKDGLFEIWAPLLIFSPFIVDATVTLLKRTCRREKVWKAHREHYYQRLVLAGWGHKKTIIVEYLLMLAAGLSGLFYGQLNGVGRLVMLVSWGFVYLLLMFTVQIVEQHEKTFMKQP